MTSHLTENLKLKKDLRFNEEGKFKILLVSDIQDHFPPQPRTVKALENIVATEKPDLVFLNGDNSILESKGNLYNLLNVLCKPMESRGIPWAHVFGNHDEEGGLPRYGQQQVYESFEHCISKTGPSDILGIGNFVLPIKSSSSDKIMFNVWGLDSNTYLHQLNDFATYTKQVEKDANLPTPLGIDGSYGIIMFDQQKWYWDSSIELEKYNGSKIPGVMFFHIPLKEFNLIPTNPIETSMSGEFNERVCPSGINSGLFSTVLQRGDIKGIFCGHDHTNSYVGSYCGIMLGYDASLGYLDYGLGGSDENNNRLRGGRIFEIDESAPSDFTTRMVYANDYIDATNGG